MAGDAKFVKIPIGEIGFGDNVRIDERNIDRLAASIAEHGVLQPITVVANEDGTGVECHTGHRRLLAARKVGLTHLTCIAVTRRSKKNRLLEQLAENLDREGMSPVEEGRVFRELRAEGMAVRAIADAFHTSASTIAMKLQLLDYPDVVQQYVHNKSISLGDALSIPLELAKRTDGRTLASVMRKHGPYMRRWVAEQVGELARHGVEVEKRQQFGTLNVRMEIYDAARAVAMAKRIPIAEFAEQALLAYMGGGDS